METKASQGVLSRLVPGVVILVVVIAVSAVGGSVTQGGMDWYRTLVLPPVTPPGGVIGLAWTLIYAMGAIAAYLIWQSRDGSTASTWLVALLIANAILNTLWTWLFFGIHWMGTAVLEMIVLNITNLAIIVLSWTRVRSAGLLFIPYFAWVCFATYLAWSIWALNR
jgi:tryptophan-rich sensory protein